MNIKINLLQTVGRGFFIGSVLLAATTDQAIAGDGEYLSNQLVRGKDLQLREMDLINVSFYLNQDPAHNPADLESWREIFKLASERVWTYTEQQAALNQVLIFTRKEPDQVDVKALAHDSHPSANMFSEGRPVYQYLYKKEGLGNEGAVYMPTNMENWAIAERRPETTPTDFGGVLAHEFGHYVFGLGDDYKVYVDSKTNPRDLRHLEISRSNSGMSADWYRERLILRSDYRYSKSPSFDDLLNNLFPEGDQYSAQNPFRSRPETIMYDARYWRVSTPDDHYDPWDGSIWINNERHAVTFATHHQMIRKESAWETMSNTRGLVIPQFLTADNETGFDRLEYMKMPELKWIIADPKVTAIVLLDRSGSMGPNFFQPGLHLMPIAISGGAEAIRASGIRDTIDGALGDFVGVASYASDTSVDANITEMINTNSQDAQITEIQNITASGLTAIGTGLRRCLEMLKAENGNTPRPGMTEAIYLLTDGIHTTGEHPEGPILTELRQRGVTIHTIALGPEADAAMLRRISGIAGGRHETVLNAQAGIGRLRNWFQDIAGEIRGASKLASLEGSVVANTTELEIVVDPYGNLESVFNLLWDTGEIDFVLVSPDGTQITHQDADTSDFITSLKSQGSHVFRIFRAEPGVWTLRLTGDASSAAAQLYNLEISGVGNSNIRMDLRAPASEMMHPEPLVIQANFSGMYPGVKGAVVTGRVFRPDGTSVPFTLHDDGDPSHGDEFADDGIYSNIFRHFAGDGEYRFEMTGFNTDGVVAWDGYVFLERGGPAEDEPVAPFSRHNSITVYYDGVPEFINATPFTEAEFASWKLDAATGAMIGSLVVENRADSHKTLIEPFWYAVTDTHNVMLAPFQTDGFTEDGDPYVDITDKVNAALQAKYGRLSMEPGESITIDGIAIYSRDRSIPDMRAVWSLWADPPSSDERRVDVYDFNADGVVDDSEVLLAVDHWHADDMQDFDLLRRIEIWKAEDDK